MGTRIPFLAALDPGTSVSGACRLIHPSRTVSIPNLGGTRSRNAPVGRDPSGHHQLWTASRHLDGWTATPVCECATHMDGFLNRRVGREHAHDYDNARQARVAPPFEHSFQR